MAESIRSRLKSGWSAFNNREKQMEVARQVSQEYGVMSTGSRPDRVRLSTMSYKTVVAPIYTRLSIDLASIPMKHVRLDQNGRFLNQITSGLNDCLTLEANLDQTARSFMQDVTLNLFLHGTVAIAPVNTTQDPTTNGAYEIHDLRAGRVTEWQPQHVRVELYDELRGVREEIWLPKRSVAIIENPLYNVMNEPNSTLQRLIRKLSILDAVDEQSSSGKLDIIIQLPYVIKSESKRDQAEKRRKDLEFQMKESKYGVGYVDATEKITQLNRPAENNMLAQVEYLTNMLYGELGLTADVFTGAADERTMLNYHNRTLEPILSAVTMEMKRKFLTKTARTQGQSIEFYRDPFKLVAVGDIAEIADKFTRNEVMTSNEIRGVIGLMPSSDAKADELRNSNMPQQEPLQGELIEDEEESTEPSEEDVMSQSFDEVDSELDRVIAELEDELGDDEESDGDE